MPTGQPDRPGRRQLSAAGLAINWPNQSARTPSGPDLALDERSNAKPGPKQYQEQSPGAHSSRPGRLADRQGRAEQKNLPIVLTGGVVNGAFWV